MLTFTEVMRTVDSMKAVGKPHTLWVSFSLLYEKHNGLANARVIFEKVVQVNYKALDDLASVWCEWAEIKLRHKNFGGELELMRQATTEPSVEIKRRVQMKLHKSLKLWAFYVDWEESLENLESTRAVCEWILDMKIATPQIIMNYALLLKENKYFEDAFRAKLERARELFGQAVEQAPAEHVKPIYLQYAKLEEDNGLAKRAMKVYDQAAKAVPDNEKMNMYEIYIARAVEIFGVPRTREIYEQAIESGLPDKDVKTMCMKYADLEKNLGDIDRARGIYIFASQFADPRSDVAFWNKWHEFEVQHGHEDTFREMLRIKRSVSASYSQTHFILPEYLMQKDQKLILEETVDTLKRAGVPEDEMAVLERQLAPPASGTTTKDGIREVGFVSAGVESQPGEPLMVEER
ncbi:hypothetical protein AMTRI_Chr04g247880 [Amborella trichopoda]